MRPQGKWSTVQTLKSRGREQAQLVLNRRAIPRQRTQLQLQQLSSDGAIARCVLGELVDDLGIEPDNTGTQI